MPNLTNLAGRAELDQATGNHYIGRAELTAAALRYLATTILNARPDAETLVLTWKFDEDECLIPQEIIYADGTTGHPDTIDEDLFKAPSHLNVHDLIPYAQRQGPGNWGYRIDLHRARDARIVPETAIPGEAPWWTVAGFWHTTHGPQCQPYQQTPAPWLRHVESHTAAAAGLDARAEEASVPPPGLFPECGCATAPTVTVIFAGFLDNLLGTCEDHDD